MKKYSFLFLVLAIFLPLHAEKVTAKTIVEWTVEEKRGLEVDRRAFLSQARDLKVDRRDHIAQKRYDKCVACVDVKDHTYHRLELKLKQD